MTDPANTRNPRKPELETAAKCAVFGGSGKFKVALARLISLPDQSPRAPDRTCFAKREIVATLANSPLEQAGPGSRGTRSLAVVLQATKKMSSSVESDPASSREGGKRSVLVRKDAAVAHVSTWYLVGCQPER
jgi:hypothetical protein